MRGVMPSARNARHVLWSITLATGSSHTLRTSLLRACRLLTDAETEALDIADRPLHVQLAAAGRRPDYADRSCVQVCGPLPEASFGDDGYSSGNAAMTHRPPVWRTCDQKTRRPRSPKGKRCFAFHFNGCNRACCLCKGTGLRDSPNG